MPGNERLIDRPQKTNPQGTDFLFVADMEGSPVGNEVKVLISDVINTDNFVTEPTPIPASNFPVCNGSNTIVDSGITVDHGQNITGTSTLTLSGSITSGNQAVTKTYADTKLAIANNLSDLASAATARTNLGLGQAAVKSVTDNTKSVVASVSGAFTTGHLLIAGDSSGTITDGGATDGFLKASNNLSDVSSAITSFNNVSPLSSKGDLLVYDGTTNARLPASTNGYVLSLDSTQSLGVKWSPPGSASSFVDNAIFAGTAATTIGISYTNLDLSQIIQSSPGNTWVVNSFTTLLCQQAGTYLFEGMIPVFASSFQSNLCFGRFAKNNFPLGATGYVNIVNANETKLIMVSAIFTLISGDRINLTAYSNGSYSVQNTLTTGSNTSSTVTITRLN